MFVYQGGSCIEGLYGDVWFGGSQPDFSWLLFPKKKKKKKKRGGKGGN